MAWTDGLGWAFRGSSGHVTDGARDQYVLHGTNSVYPQTSHASGETVTFGTTTNPNEGNGFSMRDRDGYADVRIAGVARIQNDSGTMDTLAFRVDLPNAGRYAITLAMGSQDTDSARNYWRILDNTTQLDLIDNTATLQSPGEYADAAGTIHTSGANWVSNNVAVEYDFATTTFILEMGVPGAGTASQTLLSYLHIQEVIGDIDVDIDVAGAIDLQGQALTAQIDIAVTQGAMVIAGQDISYQIGEDINVSIDVAGALTFAGQDLTSNISAAGAGISTIFLEEAEPVPGNAVFVAGIAHSTAGFRYVCAWPNDNIVSYLRGWAIRPDGAQVIVASTDVSDIYLGGFRLSTRGEMRVTTDLPTYYVAGVGLATGDMVSMTEIA